MKNLAFWAVIAGSLIGSLPTLIGVYLTNRAGDRRLRLQLQHDRQLKDREREMAFKKDTYATAAEAISCHVNAISKFSDLNFPLGKLWAMSFEKSPAIAKVNLVGGESTIRALAGFGTEFSSAFFRLAQQRITLSVLQEQIAVKEAMLRGFEKTRDAMIELMRQHNIDGVQDRHRFETIRGNFQFEADRIETTDQEIQRMKIELSAKHMPFAKQCFVESARVNEALIPLLVAARMELDTTTDEQQYAEILRQTSSTIEGQLDEFIKSVAAMIQTAPTV
jgi:hypothetical protein